jgi:hypothetical protein
MGCGLFFLEDDGEGGRWEQDVTFNLCDEEINFNGKKGGLTRRYLCHQSPLADRLPRNQHEGRER